LSADFWKERIMEHRNTVTAFYEDQSCLDTLSKVAECIVNSYKSGNKLLICGNGGSAADSQHIATELISKFLIERRALDAEALSTNTSTLTAIGNDYAFDSVFARQVEAKGRKGDVLLAISTSGNSKNVIEAIKTAERMGVVTIGLTGSNRESQISRLADYSINVPSDSTPRIQETHILIAHMLCEYVEKEICGVP
jgi:D-sedoheptulose 7-phosphate isomerase